MIGSMKDVEHLLEEPQKAGGLTGTDVPVPEEPSELIVDGTFPSDTEFTVGEIDLSCCSEIPGRETLSLEEWAKGAETRLSGRTIVLEKEETDLSSITLDVIQKQTRLAAIDTIRSLFKDEMYRAIENGDAAAQARLISMSVTEFLAMMGRQLRGEDKTEGDV